MYLHILAFFIGYILDLVFGDPHSLPHPVRLIGKLIAALESVLLKEKMKDTAKRRNGRYLVLIVLSVTVGVIGVILIGSYVVNEYLGVAVEAILTYYLLATRSLRDESMKVYNELEAGDIHKARYMLSMIVGRDTDSLDDRAIARAAIETVAENTSDGVIAPMIYVAIGGPILGYMYKAINTMDSMVGYKNDRYMYFGSCAARLDDAVNYLPARISAFYMIVSTYILGVVTKDKLILKDGTVYKIYSPQNAYHIYKRDRYNHKSPNSAHTESVCAGALGIRLAGPACYFGRLLDKPYIGDAVREVMTEDIKRANRLMYMTSVTSFFSLMLILYSVYIIFI